MVNGNCALCDKDRELCESHFMPKALGELLGTEDINPILVTDEVVMQTRRRIMLSEVPDGMLTAVSITTGTSNSIPKSIAILITVSRQSSQTTSMAWNSKTRVKRTLSHFLAKNPKSLPRNTKPYYQTRSLLLTSWIGPDGKWSNADLWLDPSPEEESAINMRPRCLI